MKRIWHIESDPLIGSVKENDANAQTLFSLHNSGKIQLKSFNTTMNELGKDDRPPYFYPAGAPDVFNVVDERGNILINNLPILDDAKADQKEMLNIEQVIEEELLKQGMNPNNFRNDFHMCAQLVSVSGSSSEAYFAVQDSDHKLHLEPLMPIIKQKFNKDIEMYTIQDVIDIEEGRKKLKIVKRPI